MSGNRTQSEEQATYLAAPLTSLHSEVLDGKHELYEARLPSSDFLSVVLFSNTRKLTTSIPQSTLVDKHRCGRSSHCHLVPLSCTTMTSPADANAGYLVHARLVQMNARRVFRCHDNHCHVTATRACDDAPEMD